MTRQKTNSIYLKEMQSELAKSNKLRVTLHITARALYPNSVTLFLNHSEIKDKLKKIYFESEALCFPIQENLYQTHKSIWIDGTGL